MYNNNAGNRNYSRSSCNDARNYSCEHREYSKEAKQLIAKLQAVDFSMVETVLYLDVYPHCQKAMSYYRELLCEREKLLEKLKEVGVPLNNMSATADNWNWTDAPWPWELEANI